MRDIYPISLYCNVIGAAVRNAMGGCEPNYGYEVGGVSVAVGVAVAVDVAVAVIVGEGDEVKVAVGGWALSLVILGAIHRA